MEKIQGIYKIRNCLNGKVYIGQSIDIETRWKKHKNNVSNKKLKYYLYNAIRKYGIENFEFLIIELVTDYMKLDEREQYWLDYYKSYEEEYGYNNSLRARGTIHSDTTKKKISDTTKLKWQDPLYRENHKYTEEQKEKLRISSSGRKQSEETKIKLRKSNLGKKVSEETKQKLREVNLGKKYSKETLQKKSEKMKELWKDKNYSEKVKKGLIGKKHSEETKRKISLKHKGRKLSKDRVQKMAKIQKDLWAVDEYRDKMLNSRKDVYTSELKEIMSKKSKERWADPIYKAKMLEVRKKQGLRQRQINAQKRLDELVNNNIDSSSMLALRN